MFKRITSLLISGALVALSAPLVLAEPAAEPTIGVTADRRGVQVTWDMDWEAGERITVLACATGTTLAELGDANIAEKVLYADVATVASDGGFSFAFELDADVPTTQPEAEYVLFLAEEDGGTVYGPFDFPYVNDSDRQTALSDIKTELEKPEKDLASLQTVLDTNIFNLQLDVTYYEAMTAVQKTQVVSNFYDLTKPLAASLDAGIVGTCFDTACGVALLQTGEDASAVADILAYYGDAVGISYAEFAALPEVRQEKIAGLFADSYANKPDITVENLTSVYGDFLILADICDSANHSVLQKKMLETYAEKLQLNLSDYHDLDAPEEVFKSLVRSLNFQTFEDVRGAFSRAVSQAEADENQSQQGGSWTGGGGGGSGSGNTTHFGPGIDDQPVPSASPTASPDPEVVFGDIDSVEWAKDSILELLEAGIVAKDTQFRPNDPITREEFTKLLVNAFGGIETDATCSYADVATGAWYYPYIATATSRGIVNGLDETQFGIGVAITREQMATMAYRAMQASGVAVTPGDGVGGFSDGEQISDYAKEAVSAMQAMSILSGMPDGTFAPQGTATRAESAKIVNAIRKLK